MIYISSSCVRAKTIRDAVLQLAEAGFRHIELSGGTEWYDALPDDLLALKQRFNLEFLCHNYFPPPLKHFVLNLASLNDETFNASRAQVRRAVELSKLLGAGRYGFHAGFLIDIPLHQIGKKIDRLALFDKQEGFKRFCQAVKEVYAETQDVKLYIENNVFSAPNAASYGGANPFFLTRRSEFEELRAETEFNLLLDLAHLKVSCTTLGLDLAEEVQFLLPQSDYVHISDNDGTVDSNGPLERDSDLFRLLERADLGGKIFTLEIYRDLQTVRHSHDVLAMLLED